MAGRKSLVEDWLTDDALLLIEGFARDKLTDKDIATKKIGVSDRTFLTWKQKYPAIVSALKKGRAPVAEEIEKSLYKLCDVQEYTETIVEETRDANGKMVSQHIRKVTRQVPPNPTAIIFALKNLKSWKWSDKRNIEVNDVEDLKPLAEMLKNDKNTDDTVGEVLTET